MKPWVYTDKSVLSSFRSGTHGERLVRGFAFVGKVPLLRSSKKCVETINPGLAPWAMQEYRPVGALR